jgi:Transposase IS66 family
MQQLSRVIRNCTVRSDTAAIIALSVGGIVVYSATDADAEPAIAAPNHSSRRGWDRAATAGCTNCHSGTTARVWAASWGFSRPIRWGVRQALGRGVSCASEKTAATCRMLLEGEEHLWTFLRVRGIEPTNNAAERALRHAVLWRKSSGGTASEWGRRFVERVLSVAATCRQQGRNVLEYLTGCFRARVTGGPLPSLLVSNPGIDLL